MDGVSERPSRGAWRLGHRALSDLSDLLMPLTCGGCGRTGTRMCTSCTHFLAGPVRHAAPDPAPPDLPPVWAAAPYDGPARAAVLALKERQRHDLGPGLGAALARTVAVAASGASVVWLVPIPTHLRVARARGGCHVSLVARHALTSLRAHGLRAEVARLLRVSGSRPDFAGLSAEQRARAVDSAFAVTSAGRSQLRAATADALPHLVLVDDVVTTGATLAAAGRALRGVAESHDMRVSCAVVTATMRRPQARRRDSHSDVTPRRVPDRPS